MTSPLWGETFDAHDAHSAAQISGKVWVKRNAAQPAGAIEGLGLLLLLSVHDLGNVDEEGETECLGEAILPSPALLLCCCEACHSYHDEARHAIRIMMKRGMPFVS